MNRDYVKSVIVDLEELRAKLELAKRTKDGRSRDKNVREAKKEISNYANGLPSDILGFLDTEVDVSALSYQWADGDIGRCISALNNWMASSLNDAETK